MSRETPASGVSEIPAPTQYRISWRGAPPSHHGQLRDAQARQSEGMAETESAVCAPFRPYQFQLDESGREMVRPLGQQSHSPRCLPKRRRPRSIHRGFSPGLESESQTLRLDRNSRIHPGEAYTLPPDSGADQARLHQPQIQKAETMNLSSYFGDTTLVLLCYKSLSPLRILQGAGIVEGDGCCPSEDPDGRGYLSARAVGRDWQASYWSQLSRLGAVVLPPPVGPESRGPDPCAVLSVRWGE